MSGSGSTGSTGSTGSGSSGSGSGSRGGEATKGPCVRREVLEEGQVWRLVLDRPKANVIDAAMTAALEAYFLEAAVTPELKAIRLEGEGPHFSFGASVEEHRPEAVASMLGTFHRLFRTMAEAAVPVVAVVRGQCLGGGLEVAAFAHRLIASPDAMLGQPEIRLGVIAPAASVILPQRMGRPAAEDLCFSGRIIPAEEAKALGLVDEIAEDPGAAAEAWIRTLLPQSASSLRFAVRAARLDFDRRLRADLEQVERLYLDELMKTADAVEGIAAFLEKRRPTWRNA